MDPEMRSLLKEVKLLQLKSQKQAEDLLMGSWRSVFKGCGVEFDEVRAFQEGDEVRSIDWNVTARHGEPFVKTFHEERKTDVYLICDISSSMGVGFGQESKRKLMAKAAAVLGFSSWENRDYTGAVLFSDGIEKVHFPKGDRRSLYALIRDIVAYPAAKKGSSLKHVFPELKKRLKKPSILIILSDFLFPCEEVHLLHLARRHRLFGIQIQDCWEKKVSDHGIALAEDSEVNRESFFDFSSAKQRKRLKEEEQSLVLSWKSGVQKCSGRFTTLQTDEPIWTPLKKLFSRR